MNARDDIEAATRNRLRAIRQANGWSLDELAARSGLSASTISRIETGHRSISLDVLLALARGLQVEVSTLLDVHPTDDEVVIRPTPTRRNGATVWHLSQPASRTVVTKMRLEPTARRRPMKSHPGSNWFYVLDGRVRLVLGERELVITAGEAAEFSTMTAHAFDAIDAAAEIILVFDADGHPRRPRPATFSDERPPRPTPG